MDWWKDVQIAGVQQQTLGGNQGLTSHLEGGRLGCIAGIGGACVFPQSYENFVFDDVACGCRTEGLVSSTFPRFLSARLAPEAVPVELNGLSWLLAALCYRKGSLSFASIPLPLV